MFRRKKHTIFCGEREKNSFHRKKILTINLKISLFSSSQFSNCLLSLKKLFLNFLQLCSIKKKIRKTKTMNEHILYEWKKLLWRMINIITVPFNSYPVFGWVKLYFAIMIMRFTSFWNICHKNYYWHVSVFKSSH